MASFSSATSSALIDTCTLRAFLSNWITRASTFSPTAKTLGALIRALAGQFGPLDEGAEVGTGDLHLDAAFLHFPSTSQVTTAPS